MMQNGTVVIMGQGYVGLPLAMAAASSGYEVIGYDINEDVVANLNSGISHIADIPSSLIESAIAKHLYRATSNAEDIAEASTVVIAVTAMVGPKCVAWRRPQNREARNELNKRQ